MFFLSNLCFLCLGSPKTSKPISIENNEGILVKKNLKYCLPEMDVDFHTYVPKYICCYCISKLECVYKFKQSCLQNNRCLKSYFQTLSSTDESYKQLSVIVTDIKFQIKPGARDKELQIREKEDKENCIVFKNETQIVDELDIEETHLFKQENDVVVKEEFPISEDNLDAEFYHEFVKSVKCDSIPSDSDVSASMTEDNTHEDSSYGNNPTNPEENVIVNKIKESKKIKCAICSREFLSKAGLKYHLKAHANIKDFNCSICKKKFLVKHNLITHEKIHTDIKDFECSICKKKFLLKHHLIAHEKTHRGIKD